MCCCTNHSDKQKINETDTKVFCQILKLRKLIRVTRGLVHKNSDMVPTPQSFPSLFSWIYIVIIPSVACDRSALRGIRGVFPIMFTLLPSNNFCIVIYHLVRVNQQEQV